MRGSWGLASIVCGALNAAASIHYVDLNSPGASSPFTSWNTAATNIQDAVDASTPGDEVVVTNGVYNIGGYAVYATMTNRVAVTKPVAVRSVNGPQFTIIEGYPFVGESAVRCVYLTNGASLDGFTLRMGASRSAFEVGQGTQASGGGIWCESNGAFISNCVVSGCTSSQIGGGVFKGTLYNCVLADNKVTRPYSAYGGGAYSSILVGCLLTNNSTVLGGAGAIFCSLTNCTLIGNSAAEQGGAAGYSTLVNCVVVSNTAAWFAGGIYESSAYNCLLVGNTAAYGGAAAFGPISGQKLANCTLVFNSASTWGGGTDSAALTNCIIYFNTAPTDANYHDGTLSYCSTPLPFGIGSITNTPGFVDVALNNFRLQPNSLCINAGRNADAAPGPDLDGNPRISRATVDLGAYEFQSPSSVISYAWLQQYALPTDGSADFADSDGDGMNNWAEWQSDTAPTNALSVLRMVSASNSPSGVQITWQSVPTRYYSLQRAATLSTTFQTIASNIYGVLGLKSYTDTSATNASSYFYRVSVP
jgi:hypothetical protein